MTQDQQNDAYPEEGLPPRRRGSGALVFAGIAVACAAGAGLGLWARPTAIAQAAPSPVETRPPALQVVVEEAFAPAGDYLEVLPDDDTPARPAPDVVVPRGAASGLVRVDAPIAATLIAPEAVAPAVAPVQPVKPTGGRPAKAAPEAAAGSRSAEVSADRPARDAGTAAPAKARIADARAAAARARKAELADAREAQAQKARAEEARAGKARAGKLARAEKARKVKAEGAEKARLAKLDARREAAAREKRRLANLAKAVKSAPGKLKAEVKQLAKKKPATQVAEARPKAPKVARPAAKTTRPTRVETAQRAPAPRRVVVPRGEGPMRVARANPCASYDPGEAVVCADPRLSARERQLQQAYRNAEAAGVPASALRAQQARWAQARAAAAREAPWAVEDVYVARISELKDQTRDAREN